MNSHGLPIVDSADPTLRATGAPKPDRIGGINAPGYGSDGSGPESNDFGAKDGYETDGNGVGLGSTLKATLTGFEAVLEGGEPSQDLKDVFDALFEAAKDSQTFSAKYKAGKYSVMTLITLLSLVLYIKSAYSISKCDFPLCKNELGKVEMLIRALIGSISANAAVAWNTLLLEFEYFEKKYIPEVVKDYYTSKNPALDRLKFAGILLFAGVFALPPTTALFKTASEWLTVWGMLEGGATFLSNMAMDILPAQIIANQKAAMAAIAVGMPFVSLIALLGYGGYKILETCRKSGKELRLKRWQHLRDTFVEQERKKYLAELDKFANVFSQETYKWRGYFKKYPFKAEVPAELWEPTPKKIRTFLEEVESNPRRPDSCCGKMRATTTYGVVGLGIVIAGGALSNVALSGYFWSIVGQLAAMMFPLYADPAKVLMNLKWWQWLVLEHTFWLPLSAFIVTVNYFSPQAFRYLFKIFTGDWDGIPGFKMFPTTGVALTLLGGYLCWESRYTARYLSDQFIAAIKVWAGDRAPEAVGVVSWIFTNSAEYIAPSNNLASWITLLNTALMELAKRGIGVAEGEDDRLFIAILEQVQNYSSLVANMDLEKFASSEHGKDKVEWVSDQKMKAWLVNEGELDAKEKELEGLYGKDGTAAGVVKVEMPKARAGLFGSRAKDPATQRLIQAEEGNARDSDDDDKYKKASKQAAGDGFSSKYSCGVM